MILISVVPINENTASYIKTKKQYLVECMVGSRDDKNSSKVASVKFASYEKINDVG